MLGFLYKSVNEKKAKEQPGVGGFRPVINWREIALRKKKTADKQILTCVFTVGASVVLFGIILLILGLVVFQRECPKQMELKGGLKCIVVFNQSASWQLARQVCEEQGGQLLDVSNERENKEVSTALFGQTWIGLFRKSEEPTFQWTSKMKLSFRNWGNGIPSGTPPQQSECVYIDQGGLWYFTTQCSQRFYIACEHEKYHNPLVLIGPVLSGCGFLILLLSVEVCKRHRQTVMKTGGVIEDQERPSSGTPDTLVVQESKSSASPAIWKHGTTNKTTPINQKLTKTDSISVIETPTSTLTIVDDGSMNMSSSLSAKSGFTESTDTNFQEKLEIMLNPKEFT